MMSLMFGLSVEKWYSQKLTIFGTKVNLYLSSNLLDESSAVPLHQLAKGPLIALQAARHTCFLQRKRFVVQFQLVGVGWGGMPFVHRFTVQSQNTTDVWNLYSIWNGTVGVVTNPLQMFPRKEYIDHILLVYTMLPSPCTWLCHTKMVTVDRNNNS